MELFSRIQLLVEQNNKIIRVEYDLATPTRRIKLEGTKPFCTIFLRDYSCSITYCQGDKLKEKIRNIYREFMLEKFGEEYHKDALAYDERKALSV